MLPGALGQQTSPPAPGLLGGLSLPLAPSPASSLRCGDIHLCGSLRGPPGLWSQLIQPWPGASAAVTGHPRPKGLCQRSRCSQEGMAPPARLCPEANLLLLQGVWPRALGTQRPLLLSTLLPLGAAHTWTGTLSSVDTEPSVPAGGTAGPQSARRGWSCVRPQAPKSLSGTLG